MTLSSKQHTHWVSLMLDWMGMLSALFAVVFLIITLGTEMFWWALVMAGAVSLYIRWLSTITIDDEPTAKEASTTRSHDDAQVQSRHRH
ncbi:MAG: hypothetical protein HQL50_00730 [Magnetococcales bacterium]|nr:hypothetical protein [Magnetococcales bacterium]